LSTESLHELLKKLGFTSYEAKAYITLVLNGSLTATELAMKSEIPQPRVYDIVQSLLEKGLIMVSEGRPRKFQAISPTVALRNYVNRKRQLEDEALETFLAELTSHAPASTEAGVWTSSGYTSALNLLRESFFIASDELLFAGYLEILEELEEAAKKPLSTCVVLYDAIEEATGNLKLYDEVRVKPTKAPVMLIPDFRHALVIIDWETRKPTSYLITDENLIKIFAVYYLSYIRSGSKLIHSRLDTLDKRSYVHLTRALDHVRILREKGRRVFVRVIGRRTSDGRLVELEGEVVGEFENSFRSIGYLTVRLADGREVTVGGIGAYLEDVEARRIEIIAQK